MIKKQAGYYYCIDESQDQRQSEQIVQSPTTKQDKPQVPLQVLGNVKQYIQQVAGEVARIKQLKKKQKQQQLANKLVLDELMPVKEASQGDHLKGGQIKLEVGVPKEIYELEQRIAKLEQKIVNDEIVKQKIQRKGKLSERAKQLSTQIRKLSEKSIDSISSNIQTYCKNLEQKQQQNKALFLYDTFSKTSALSEQIEMLDIYLANLSSIMMKFKALPPLKMIVDNHDKLLEKREKNKENIQRLYKYMSEEYEKVMKEIDNI